MEILIAIALNTELIECDLFRDKLSQELSEKKYGSCHEIGLRSPGFTNYYVVQVDLTNYREGLNVVANHCRTMEPKPLIRISLVGSDDDPIQVFPRNDLSTYFEGLESGDKYQSETEKTVWASIGEHLRTRKS